VIAKRAVPITTFLLQYDKHDLRHTFATWLEDAGIRARVIDEMMGHADGRRGEHHGSRIGSVYRHTTPAMEQRIRDEISKRLIQAGGIAGKP
jgi:integrase